MTISNQASGIRPGVCSSTTRPTAPFTGQIIYETDTGYLRVWDGSNWDYLSQSQDTTTNLPVSSISAVPKAIVTYTSNGTFTKASYPTATALIVHVQGAGGGGVSVPLGATTQWAAGGGGQAGAYIKYLVPNISAIPSSVSIVIGAGGSNQSGATGDTGGTTTAHGFDSSNSLSAGGGAGGQYSGAATSGTARGWAGSGGGAVTVGNTANVIYSTVGRMGVNGWATATLGLGGRGGDSIFGNAGNPYINVDFGTPINPLSSDGYGSGGSSNAVVRNTTPGSGRAGTNGIVIVEVY